LPRQFDVVIERDEEGNYIASVPQLPGCHTQARSLDEVAQRIREAVELCLEVTGAPEQTLEFVGIQRITIEQPEAA
jgi:predicted RNase H-like HicB family nuclease